MNLEKTVCDFFMRKITRCQYIAMISTVLCGLIAHGYMLNNKISYHDDVYYYFQVGETFRSGRWALGVIRECFLKLGIKNYSTPFWNGLLFILFLAIVSALLISILDIKQPLVAGFIGGILIVFPTSTSIFAYMFTTPYYGFSILLETLAVYLVVKNKKGGGIWGVLLIAFGNGIYQAYFGVATTLFVLVLLLSEDSFFSKWKKAWKYLLVLSAGLGFYFIGNKICTQITRTTLVDYQGIDEMTSVSAIGIVQAIIRAYKDFVLPLHGDFYGISAVLWIRLLYAFLFVILLISLIVDWCRQKSVIEKLFQLALYLLIPLSVNIVYVMTSSDASVVHTLMVVPYVFVLIYPIAFLLKNDSWEWLTGMYYIVIALMIVFYAKLDNTAYLKMTHQQETAISYYNTIISQIKGLDNYNPYMPVLFYGQRNITDKSIVYFPEYDTITLKGYSTNEYEFMSYWVDENFLKIHCGYQYQIPSNREEIIETEQFAEMPCYPAAGSVGIINETVVVKFAESE